MNTHPGVIGRKLGMTQVFAEDGSVIPCTVVESRAVVVAKRTQEKDGYSALVLGLNDRSEKHTKKPMAGFYKKASVAPKRFLREIRCSAEVVAGYEVGQEIKLDSLFQEGQFVDVCGITRGRGFTGVMRLHNFAGQVTTHGTHEYKRHGGSIGTNMTPGRVMPGKKMGGQYGNERVSVLNQRVVKILADENLVFIAGGIPGSRNSLVYVRGAIKRGGGVRAEK
jgi:large subunit ribosomal protein L3